MLEKSEVSIINGESRDTCNTEQKTRNEVKQNKTHNTET
jgi:hypothetical protein